MGRWRGSVVTPYLDLGQFRTDRHTLLTGSAPSSRNRRTSVKMIAINACTRKAARSHHEPETCPDRARGEEGGASRTASALPE